MAWKTSGHNSSVEVQQECSPESSRSRSQVVKKAAHGLVSLPFMMPAKPGGVSEVHECGNTIEEVSIP